MKSLIDYIESLESQPFDGWSDETKAGYLTACASIKARVEAITSKVAICPGCGVIVQICHRDWAEADKGTGKKFRRLARRGFKIELVTTEQARNGFGRCECKIEKI